MIQNVLAGLFVLGVGAWVGQTPTKAVVYPTGLYPDDLKNVQKAVDENSEVLLKAMNAKGRALAFNFGKDVKSPQEGGVQLSRDVVIRGETVHGQQTTIQGGFDQLVCTQLVKSDIEGIHFDAPTGAAIVFQKTTGMKIVGNRITRVAPVFARGTAWGRGIWGYGAKPADVSGHIEISLNTIDQIDGSASYGISISNCDAEIDISKNTVTHTNLNGILVGANSHDAWITHNRVTPGSATKFKDSIGNGILVGHSRGGVYHIMENTIKCENPQADGLVIVGSIALPTSNSQLIANDVEMIGSTSSAIGIYGQVSRSVIFGNRIKGTAAYGIQISSNDKKDSVSAADNTIMSNQITGLHTTISDLFLDAISNGTVAKGNGGSFVDKGTENTIDGFSMKP